MKFDNRLLYHKIKEYLKKEIETKAESNREVRIDSERKMMADLGVSRSSINKAISELSAEGFLIKKIGKGVFIPPKEQLLSQFYKLNTIALILPDITDYYYGEIAREIESNCYDKGINLMLCVIGNDPEKEKKYLSDIQKANIKGIISAPFIDEGNNAQIYQKLYNSGVSIVLINRISGSMNELPNVLYDQGEGSYQAVYHFIERGRKNLLFIGDLRKSYLCRLRYEGYLKAINENTYMKSHELSFDDKDFEKQLIKIIGKETIDGIIIYNDIIAIKVMRMILNHGLTIPVDIGIVSHDDSYFADMAHVPLTSVHFPKKKVADTAFDILFSIAQNLDCECQQTVPTSLAIRESTNYKGK